MGSNATNPCETLERNREQFPKATTILTRPTVHLPPTTPSSHRRFWQARIARGKHIHFLGCYDTFEEAARAYDLAAVKLRDERVALNRPYATYAADLPLLEATPVDAFLDKLRASGRSGKRSSRFRGVSWHKCRSNWAARIRSNDQRVNIGGFDDEIAAARAVSLPMRPTVCHPGSSF